MSAERRKSGLVYRLAIHRNKDFTPRNPQDTEQPKDPGRLPGLSTSEAPKNGRLNQVIDLALLKEPLRAFADALNHVAIVPVNDHGEIDREKLEEWASFRDKKECHPLTQIMLDAIVGEV